MASVAEKLEAAPINRPDPQPLLPDQGEQGPYPTDALGRYASGATRAIANLAFTPESLAAQSVLAACSLAVQAYYNVRLPTGQVRPASLFLVSVAESGDRKSTADDMALAPVRDFENDLERLHAQELQSTTIKQSAWDEAKKNATNVHKKSGTEALENAYQDLGPRPKPPVEPVIVVKTGTTQGLVKRMATCRPSLGLMSDEGGLWLGGFGMSAEQRLSTITTLSSLWDGSPIQSLTASEGLSVIRGRRLSFHMMMQPNIAAKLLGDSEAQGQGFLSRILVSHPKSLAGTRFRLATHQDDPQALHDLGEFKQRLSDIVRHPIEVEDEYAGLQPRQVNLDEAATAAWFDFYNEVEGKLGDGGEYQSVKGFVGKLPEMAARMAVVVAGFDIGRDLRVVNRVQMAAGIELARFYLNEALRLFGKHEPTPDYRDAQELSDWLATKWSENLVSATAIRQKGPGNLRSGTKHIETLLTILSDHDHVTPVEGGGQVQGKHARKAWRVHVGRT